MHSVASSEREARPRGGRRAGGSSGGGGGAGGGGMSEVLAPASPPGCATAPSVALAPAHWAVLHGVRSFSSSLAEEAEGGSREPAKAQSGAAEVAPPTRGSPGGCEA